MRKLLIAAVLLAVAASTAVADPPDEDVHRPYVKDKGLYYLQFDLGFNLSFLDGNSVARFPTTLEGPTDQFESGLGVAPLFGITIGRQFSNHFALSLSADYDAHYTTRSRTVQDTCPLFDPFGTVVNEKLIDVSKNFNVTANYVSFSVLANFNFDKLFFYVGPSIGVPVGFEVNESEQILDTTAGCSFFYPSADTTKSVAGTIRSTANTNTRIALRAGVGYLIPLSKSIFLVPQVGFDLGFSNTLNQDEVNALTGDAGPSSKGTVINGQLGFNALQATIGLRVNL